MLSSISMLSGLNPKQYEAVINTDGPVMIVAGAGSGKTKVLTTRIKYLLQEKNISPENILAVTFTNKAAREMEQRIGIKLPWIGTFHGICGKLLRRHIHNLAGYTQSYVIFDDNDQLGLVKTLLREMNFENKQLTSQMVLNQISKAKNKMISPEEYLAQAQNDLQEKVGLVYKKYQEMLRRNNAVDFDDMLLLVLEIFEKHPDILQEYQRKFKYILVDEYQDTNKAQYLLISKLASYHRNICIVGDSDQSIYSWRGADFTNIFSFEKDFPESKIILLEQNYRSTGNILAIANAVIKNNVLRKEKKLWTENPDGEKAVFFYCGDEHAEVECILDALEKEMTKYPDLHNYAIFYRTNAQSRVFEEGLMRRGIKYRLIGGVRFYQRREVKDILSYLRLILNHNDELSLQRIINLPARGIGEVTLARYRIYAESKNISLFQALQERIEDVSERTFQAIQDFTQLILKFSEVQLPLADLIEQVIHQSGYHAMLLNSGDDTDLDRLDNIFELVTMAKEKGDITLAEFLEQISLMADIDNLPENNDAVTLMTIHCAKGLEFPVVFVVGLEEGLLPHFRSLYEPEMLEEERRLFYVAITRAQQKLYLSAARTRAQAGETRFNARSRFLEEIPEELLEKREMEGNLFAIARKKAEPEIREIPEYRVGESVFHNKWGKGSILKVIGSGEEQVLDIQFLRFRKTILAKYAQLQKL